MTGVVEIEPSLALAAAARRLSLAGAKGKGEKALRMIEEQGLAKPSFCFRATGVSGVRGGVLEVGGIELPLPELAGLSPRLTAVAAAACTLGPALEERVSELCASRSISLALALDEAGNAMLMYTARLAVLEIRRRARAQGITTGDLFSPGGRGFGLEHQEAVLELAAAGRLGIQVSGQGMLSPVKSRSMILGMGTGLSAKPTSRRCETCSSAPNCGYRKKTTPGAMACRH